MDSRNRDNVNDTQSTSAGDRNTSSNKDTNLDNDLGSTRNVSSNPQNKDDSYKLGQKQGTDDLKDTTSRNSDTVGSSGMKNRSSGIDSDRDDLGISNDDDSKQDIKKNTAGFKDPRSSEH